MNIKIRRLAKKALREVRHLSPIPKRAKYFVLIAQERTGSTLFSDLMSFHPKILMNRHLFYTIETWPSRYRAGRILFSTKPVRGYKFKVVHAPLQNDPAAANEYLSDLSQRVEIIRLERKNKLRQALSAGISRAIANGKLHIWKGEGRSETVKKPIVDVQKVLEDIEYYTNLSAFEDQALEGVPHLELKYERDLLPQDRHQATANRAFEYLGLQPTAVETRLERVSKPTIADNIANYEELVTELRDSPYDHYLTEHTV